MVCNFYGRPAEGPLLPVREGQVLISNYPEPPAGRRLRPYEAVWYLCRNDRADPAPSGQ